MRGKSQKNPDQAESRAWSGSCLSRVMEGISIVFYLGKGAEEIARNLVIRE